MNKIKANKAGMTLVEVLVAMTLFTVMFMMIFGIMIHSVKMNAQTRKYDQEIDVHIEEAERFNPMAVEIDGNTSNATLVEEYMKDKQLDFIFGAGSISIKANAFQVISQDEDNAFNLKFFNNTRPDIANHKYWVRLYNVTSDADDSQKVCLYLPKTEAGSFFIKNGSEAISDKATRLIPPKKAVAIGFDSTNSSSNVFFYVSTLDAKRDEIVNMAEDKNLIKVKPSQLVKYDKENDGYIDIYLTDDGFMGYDDYQTYLNSQGG